MILDYNYNNHKKNLSISYVKENGMKGLLNYNVQRFKTYTFDKKGKFTNWDGRKCSEGTTEKPHKFDIWNFIDNLPEKDLKLIDGKLFPKMYTFDIEVEVKDDEFPNPVFAKTPITTISISNPNFDTIVLGTRELSQSQIDEINSKYKNYISNVEFWQKLDLQIPEFKYRYFTTEKEMVEYFLKMIVAKVPILAGWNSIGFDWHYIHNRILNNFPDLSISMGSIEGQCQMKTIQDFKRNKYQIPIPNHTVILDWMDVLEQDYVVLPIKESQSLDYIAGVSLGVQKIEYSGTIQDLYNNDYDKYVYYNAVDSLLVQLIDQRFKTMNNLYISSQFCREKIGRCFSKIALAEALVFQDLKRHGFKSVVEHFERGERETLYGAFVKQPTPGLYKWIACNDFASLYPSSITTCNMSFENYLGSDFTDEEIEEYKKDSGYFVSVNNNVYRNDKDYAMKRIQIMLKKERDSSKYVSKELDAQVMSDISAIQSSHNPTNIVYNDRMQDIIKELGYSVKSTEDVRKMSDEEREKFKYKLQFMITYLTSKEQSMKILGNSIYGGSSHQAFFWFNIRMANDITGESKNLILLMVERLNDLFKNKWVGMKDLHKKLGVEIKKEYL